jgi:hypothetical protein
LKKWQKYVTATKEEDRLTYVKRSSSFVAGARVIFAQFFCNVVPLLNSSEPEDSLGHRKKRGAGDPHSLCTTKQE